MSLVRDSGLAFIHDYIPITKNEFWRTCSTYYKSTSRYEDWSNWRNGSVYSWGGIHRVRRWLIRVTPSSNFTRQFKKLHSNEQLLVDQAIDVISDSPSIGRAKNDDLTAIYVYKFRGIGRILLIGYVLLAEDWIQVIKVGPHENFYRDLKRENWPIWALGPPAARLTPARDASFVTSQRSCDEPLAGNLSHFGPLIS